MDEGDLFSEEQEEGAEETDASSIPPMPAPTEPEEDWPHRDLYEGVKDALYILPSRFESTLNISEVLATDLHTFNTSLGATIEAQVVGGLNDMRDVWDPDKTYSRYRFVRQDQTFPDVILSSVVPNPQMDRILMGIELKGWYALSREAEPSFRFLATPGVCAPQDLLVVFPWALSAGVSGVPLLFPPYVIGSRTAAELRNWFWEHVRDTEEGVDKRVLRSEVERSYPSAGDPISDRAAQDGGGNFGRFARTRVRRDGEFEKIMHRYIDDLFTATLSGIPLAAWQRFLTGRGY